jgi:EAL domain-containing protein (putative c-di-GMP-specific phosphodiesterase class I)
MGKSLQPLNAMAVRPPANTPAAAPAGPEPVTAESLGWQLRAALPPLRLHSVSLYDEQANVLWLSEGALGPDEHNLVLEAMDKLANDRSMPCYETGMEDGRVGLFLPVRAPQGDLVGVAMILADLKSVSDGVLERIVSPQMRTIMQKIAVLLRASSKTPSAEPPAPIPVAVASVLELAPERAADSARAAPSGAGGLSGPGPGPSAAASASGSAAKSVAPAATKPASTKAGTAHATAAAGAGISQEEASLSPQAIDDILEFEILPEAAAAPAEKSPPGPAAAAPQSTTLTWDPSDGGLELVPDHVPVALPAEVAKATAAAVAPPRTTAPVTKPVPPAMQATPAPTRSAADASFHPTQGHAGTALNGATANAHPASGTNGAGSSYATQAPASTVATPTSLSVGAASPAAIALGSLQPPIPTAEPAPPAPTQVPTLGAAASSAVQAATPLAPPAILAPASAEAGGAVGVNHSEAVSATAVSLAPAVAGATVAGASSTRSTNATTTTRAIQAGATTGTVAAPNNSSPTGTVPALNNPGATGTSRSLALDPSSLILDVQPFSKLRAGGRMRRYEVLPRIPNRDSNRAPAAMDGLALQRLLSWLGSNRSAWSLEPTSFSLNLSISTLEDPRFLQHVASCLKANGIAPDNVGFEIAEPLCTQYRAQVERFISLCDKLGCFVVIDDFSFDSSVLPLLRSKALRLVKIDPKLTSVALRDKLSQAMVVAIVQAVKVLGIHCAAKRVESQASLQWLTAIGCDLAQGPALSQVLPIESLNMPQPPSPTEPPKAS